MHQYNFDLPKYANAYPLGSNFKLLKVANYNDNYPSNAPKSYFYFSL